MKIQKIKFQLAPPLLSMDIYTEYEMRVDVQEISYLVGKVNYGSQPGLCMLCTLRQTANLMFHRIHKHAWLATVINLYNLEQFYVLRDRYFHPFPSDLSSLAWRKLNRQHINQYNYFRSPCYRRTTEVTSRLRRV